MVDTSGTHAVSILTVIVLHKMTPQDSASYRTWLQAKHNLGPSEARIGLMFFDNTPGGQSAGTLPEETIWVSDGKNAGLATAYNRGIAEAQRLGYEWMLTLDQDTSLPEDFLSKLSDAVAFVAPQKNISAVVPLIYDGDRLISPNGLKWDIYPTFFAPGFTGIASESSTSAINSASTLRVSALLDAGGYDTRFPLDYSDAVMYRKLHAKGYRIYVAGNIRVDHELSVLDMKTRVSPQRYEMILGTESAFWDQYLGGVAHLALTLRYIYRVGYKLWQTGGDFTFVKISARYFARRIFLSKERRLRDWEQATRKQFDDLPA